MDKIVRTVYRQLYKKAASVDKDIAMRSVLTCSPLRRYDHRRGMWVAFDVAKESGWPESRVFLDDLIRKLNHGREFFIPSPPNGHTAADSKGSSDGRDGVGDGSSSAGSVVGDNNNNNNNNINADSCVNEPSSTLRQVLRKSFEETPFTVTQMNNAFAALKELAYVTDMASKHYGSAAFPPEESKTLPVPKLTVVDNVEDVHSLSLTKGLSDVLDRLNGDERGILSRTSSERRGGGDDDENVAVKEETPEADAARKGKNLDSDKQGTDDDVDESNEFSGKNSNKNTPFETPKSVHLLLSHPQLYDFFRYTVMIVVRSTPSEAAAFVLNKPLENNEGMVMPVNATIRLNHVHPILGKHLGNHTVMIGGPVGRGSFDSSILLLHRVPDVDNAIPVSQSLWVDGDYDVLQRKLEDGTAKASDIIVICGFSGWGGDQLAGEIHAGTWVVARGSTDDPAIDDYIFALAQHAGTAPTPASASVSISSTTSKQRGGMKRGGDRSRSAASWAWAYNALGAPYASLARNQKPLMQDPPTD